MAAVFDIERGVICTAGDPELLRRIGATLAKDLDQRLGEISQALATGDLVAVGRSAHRHKGATLTVGALALAERFTAIDQAARRGDLHATSELVKGLGEDVAAFRSAFAAWQP